MIGLSEILHGLYGAYRLCRFDMQGLGYFNATPEGFWRSFFSAVLVAPAYFLIVFLDLDLNSVEASLGRILLLESLAYVILVFLYPLIMHYICQALDRQPQYIMYIVAYNWAGVLLNALELPAKAFVASGLSPDAAQVLDLAVLILTIGILWFIARTALQITRLTAAALVALDLLLTIAVNSIVAGRLGIA
ncbi:MAG: hypothetical protein ACHQF3_06000 [Alphaproteobacteria bacterium]